MRKADQVELRELLARVDCLEATYELTRGLYDYDPIDPPEWHRPLCRWAAPGWCSPAGTPVPLRDAGATEEAR